MLTNCDCIFTAYGKLNKNDLFIYEDHILKVVDKSHSKPGKHGAAKVKMTCFDYFVEGRKQIVSLPATETAQKVELTPKVGYITRVYEKSELYQATKSFSSQIYSYEELDQQKLTKQNSIIQVTCFIPEFQQAYFIVPDVMIKNVQITQSVQVKYVLTKYGRKIISAKQQ